MPMRTTRNCCCWGVGIVVDADDVCFFFEASSVLSAASKRATCSKISVAVSWRRKPIWPVAQKTQPIAQPAWLDTQAVARPSSYRMSTDSIAGPSPRRYARLIVPSFAERCSATSSRANGPLSVRRAPPGTTPRRPDDASPDSESSSSSSSSRRLRARCARSGLGRFDMASKSVTPPRTQWRICCARYGFSPHAATSRSSACASAMRP
mmetsp:Transcript_22558/g.89588  ORF Transcript_22558/g.89588 Transcript_22558/m.89588 type:complete len:208 (-) Transcript_22558:166-789(-)